jgi:transcriptional regulator with XRE-family HTH domain
MRLLREMSGLGSRPYPLDHERRRNVLVTLAKKDMTISSLAREINVAQAIVSQVINGRRRSEKTEQRIADFLNKPADSLFPIRTPAEIKKMRQAEAAAKGKAAS